MCPCCFQVDGSTIKNLCSQHGPLQTFLHSAQFGQAYVCYKAREDAVKAQGHLSAFPFGSTLIKAEFVSDADAQRLQEMSSGGGGGGSQWPPQVTPPQVVSAGLRPPFPGQPQVNGGNMWSSSGSLWSPLEEHADNMLPGGLLGGH